MRPCLKENKPERLDFTAGMTRLLGRKGSPPTSQFLLLVTMFLFGKALKSLQVTKQKGDQGRIKGRWKKRLSS